MKKIKQFLKEYPVIIGGLSIVALLSMIVVFWYWQREHQVISSVVPEELAREQTIDKITDPRDVAFYVMNAVEQQDLDMFLRSCPIDEMGLGMNSAGLIDREGRFTNEAIIAPAANYREYFPVSSAEITGKYVEEYRKISDDFHKLKNPKVLDVAYAKPDEQLLKEFRYGESEICDLWNGKALCEVMVLLESEGEQYLMVFTLISYYDFWKVYSVQSELLGLSERGTIYPVTEEEYIALKNEKRQIALHESLKEIVRGVISKDEESEEKEEQNIVKKTIEAGDSLLTPNYVVLNTSYGRSAEDAISQFTISLQKKDWTAAMSFINVSEEPRQLECVTTEMLSEQAEMARIIKSFYYHILLEGKSLEGKSLEEIGKSGARIIQELNPEYSFYIDLNKVEKTEDPVKYKAYFYYMGDRYEAEFLVSEFEEGWMIKDIGENVRKLSKTEVKELLD